MNWYAIKTVKKGLWSVGTFASILENEPYKEKYASKDYKVLGPFPSCKAAEAARQVDDEWVKDEEPVKKIGTMLTGNTEEINRLKRDRNVLHLNVYTNSKSISTTPFKFQNRELGIIYVSKEKIREWYGRTLINKSLKLIVRKQLISEVG